MKLAASQIAWQPEQEAQALDILRDNGFAGLEIAPPRVAGPAPYAHPEKAAAFAAAVRRSHNLAVCSMQSIWYGQSGSMFGAQAGALLAYTEAAVRFARAAGCRNLVFGCPQNRVLPQGETPEAAVPFFAAIGAYAARYGAVVALEANPALYGTNFINTTAEAFAMAKAVGESGFMVNLDFGTMVANGEDAAALRGRVGLVHHVHISEPHLVLIERREAHRALAQVLREEGYAGYVSVEMKQQSLDDLQKTVRYVAEVFA